MPLPVNGSMKEAESPIANRPDFGAGSAVPKPSRETLSQSEQRRALRSVRAALWFFNHRFLHDLVGVRTESAHIFRRNNETQVAYSVLD